MSDPRRTKPVRSGSWIKKLFTGLPATVATVRQDHLLDEAEATPGHIGPPGGERIGVVTTIDHM
ncbi:hypothetical protein [Kibdelosporangium aridum]|uniref:hypothetical protein n=1 Tax=Kibdelosporangium aridum TaxID=2030 RepID=UPI0035E90F75